MIWLELAVVLAAIWLGARVGGAGLGTMGGLGLAALVFLFGLPPASPPGQVIAIVVAVVTAAATMQAAGGMDLMVGIAERMLRARPAWITFMGPIVAYLFTFCAGTGHVAYAVLPIIADVARQAGVRPERPVSISVIASQQAITASPLSAATAGLLGLLATGGLQVAGRPVELWHVLVICIPATFLGCMIGALSVLRFGRELKDDPVYQERLAKGEIQPPAAIPRLEGVARRNAIGATATFLGAAAVIVLLGLIPELRPSWLVDEAEKSLDMPTAIQLLMYAAAAIMMLAFGAKPEAAVKTPVATAGVVAVVSIVGLGWMGNCFFKGNESDIVASLSGTVSAHPWLFAVGLFALSILLFSQASTVAALMPLGISLGIAPALLIACFPAVNGYFFLPTYGTIVAAVSFDRTGTTRIGKYVLNHSFMLPGFVSTISAVVIGLLIAKAIA